MWYQGTLDAYLLYTQTFGWPLEKKKEKKKKKDRDELYR